MHKNSLASDLIEFARAVTDHKLTVHTSGNISLKYDEETFLISATGSQLRSLAKDQISQVRISDGKSFQGPPPSIEKNLHQQIYQARSDVNAVLHCHAPWSTILACHPAPPENLAFIPEFPVYVDNFTHVPYSPPGSTELASSVASAFKADLSIKVVQMQNHGQVIVGIDWQDVVRRAVFFEQACWMYCQNPDLIPLSRSQENLLKQRYKPPPSSHNHSKPLKTNLRYQE